MPHDEFLSEDLFREFTDFVEYIESNYGHDVDVTKEGLLRIHNDTKGALIQLCIVDQIASALRTLLDAVIHYPEVEDLELYYVGELDPDFDLHNFIAELPVKQQANRWYSVLPIMDAWQLRPALLFEHTLLGDYVRSTYASKLQQELKELKTGEGGPFESLVERILRFALYPCVDSILSQVRSVNGNVRRDFKIALTRDSILRDHLSAAGFPANNILIEAKNCETNSGDNIDQVAIYLARLSFAKVGFLITRKKFSTKMREKVVEHRYISFGTTIVVPLDDDDLMEMLDNAGQGQFKQNERLLKDRFERVLDDA